MELADSSQKYKWPVNILRYLKSPFIREIKIKNKYYVVINVNSNSLQCLGTILGRIQYKKGILD